jgi:hypothetical protein
VVVEPGEGQVGGGRGRDDIICHGNAPFDAFFTPHRIAQPLRNCKKKEIAAPVGAWEVYFLICLTNMPEQFIISRRIVSILQRIDPEKNRGLNRDTFGK